MFSRLPLFLALVGLLSIQGLLQFAAQWQLSVISDISLGNLIYSNSIVITDMLNNEPFVLQTPHLNAGRMLA